MRSPKLAALILFFAALSFAQQPLPVREPLPRATPESQGVASSAVLKFVDEADKIDAMNSVIIVRHGKVIAEGWWTPYDAQTPHILYSLSKSFTSTAVGLAISEGKLSLDDEVLKTFPEYAPAQPSENLKAMRLRDLLRMATGSQTEAKLWHDPKEGKPDDPWAQTFLNHPVEFKPGTHFLYNSPGTYMASAMVQKATGQSVLEYLKPRLFEPLAFDNPWWVASPQGVTAGAYGLLARTEDIAKFGQLYLQKGKWNGKQLVPAEWVEQATKIQTANGSSPNSDWDQGYGYQFWRARHNAYRGDGAFGQYCVILPDQDTVVAITSGVKDMQHTMNVIWDVLLPALGSNPLPEDTTSQKQLQARLSALQIKLPAGHPTGAIASKVSGKWFNFDQNDLGIKSLALDFSGKEPVLLVRTAEGETRTPIGIGSWAKGGNFNDGIDTQLGVPPHPMVAASGAWIAEDTFGVKLVAYQTPFYSTLKFRFAGDQLTFDSQQNVSFEKTDRPQLIGHAGK